MTGGELIGAAWPSLAGFDRGVIDATPSGRIRKAMPKGGFKGGFFPLLCALLCACAHGIAQPTTFSAPDARVCISFTRRHNISIHGIEINPITPVSALWPSLRSAKHSLERAAPQPSIAQLGQFWLWPISAAKLAQRRARRPVSLEQARTRADERTRPIVGRSSASVGRSPAPRFLLWVLRGCT